MKTVKVEMLRLYHEGELYLPKGTTQEIPEDLAKRLAAGKKPTVKLIKG